MMGALERKRRLSVITAGICYQERNRAAIVPGLRAMLTGEENDIF
jgi:hypothetical protein